MADTRPQVQVDRLLIPNLNLDLTYTTGSAKVLNDGLWYRKPENGNPEKGGNFILSGHRFELGLTPGDTRRRSPLYHIDILKVGDDLFVDYKGKRYAYKVSRIYDVERTALEIEAPSAKPKLTLYTCNIKGEKAGRVVVEASPVTN